MNISLANWPTIDTGKWKIELPLPKPGAPGHHICTLGGDECVSCRLERDAQDRVLRARMLSDREAGTIQRTRPPSNPLEHL